MTDYKTYVLVGFGVACAIAFLGVISVAFGVTPNGNQADDEPEVTGLELLDADASETDKYKTITKQDDGSYKVEGRIVGSMGGGDVVVKSVESDSGTVKVNLGVEQSGVGTTVLTGYEYEMNVVNVGDRELSVIHGDEASVEDPTPEPSAELIDTSADSSTTTERSSVSFGEDEATVKGVIVGNTGGQEVFIENVENKDGKTYLEVDLEETDGFATQVITGYKYEIDVSNPEDTIVVQHGGKTVGNYEEESSNEDVDIINEDYQYDFYEDEGDADEVAELVESNQDSFVIEGSFVTGSSTCSEASLDDINLNDGKMKVNLSPETNTPITGACTDDISPSSYRLEVEFATDIDTVVVEAEQEFEDDVKKRIDL